MSVGGGGQTPPLDDRGCQEGGPDPPHMIDWFLPVVVFDRGVVHVLVLASVAGDHSVKAETCQEMQASCDRAQKATFTRKTHTTCRGMSGIYPTRRGSSP